MANSTTNLDLISASQASKEVTANALADAGSPATLFGRRASTTTGLTWGFYGGVLNVSGTPTQIANGTVALTGSATNYVEATTAGVVSANASGFTAGRLRLYTIVTGASSITSYTDHRHSGTGAGIAATANIADTDLVYTSDTDSTADSDPGNGLFKWNHATQSSATALYVDNQTTAGVSLTTFFAALPADGFIHLAQQDDAAKWQLWKWSGLPTAGTGYYKFTGLTLMANGGTIADAKAVSITFNGTPPATQPFDATAFYPGVPTASAKVLRVPIARAVIFAGNFAGSYGKAGTASTGTATFDVQKNGSSIGTVVFTASATATFTTSGGTSVSFAAGDVLSIIAPGSADATLADIGVVLAGTR